jgi:hypothetical protein
MRPSRNRRRREDQCVLRGSRPGLTVLAPDIVEAILGGRQPAQMMLAVLMRRFPVLWLAQRLELLHPVQAP